MWRVHISSKEPGADDLVSRLEMCGISATRTDMPVCDVAFVYADRTHVHAEIKSYSDLLASIKDGRYREQSASMAHSGVPFTFYLIRGCIAPPGVSPEEQTKLQHAMTRVQLSGPLPVTPHRTHMATIYLTTSDGVFGWIKYVHGILLSDPIEAGGVVAPLSDTLRHEFGSKAGARTQAKVYGEMLGRLSGVGPEKARAVASSFPSMARLIEWLRSHTSQADLVTALRMLNPGLADRVAERLYTEILMPDERRFDWTPAKGRRGARAACGSRVPSLPS
jgi:ERCC4-type nuclease